MFLCKFNVKFSKKIQNKTKNVHLVFFSKLNNNLKELKKVDTKNSKVLKYQAFFISKFWFLNKNQVKKNLMVWKKKVFYSVVTVLTS